MRKSIKSVFSVNQQDDDVYEEKQSIGLLQINSSMNKDDKMSFEREHGIQNDNFMQNITEPNTQQFNQNTSQSQSQFSKNLKNFNKFSKNIQNEVKQNGEESHFQDNFILSSPTSHIFKSNEDLFLDQTNVPKKLQRPFDYVNASKEDEEKFFSKKITNEDYANFNTTTNRSTKQLQISDLRMLQSSDTQRMNTKNREDDYNFTGTPSEKGLQMKESLRDSQEKINSDQVIENNHEKTPKQSNYGLKFSLDTIIQKKLQIVDNKKQELEDELVQSNPASQQSNDPNNNQNNFMRKLTNAQSVNLSQSKVKKFFGRKSEFGLARSQVSNDNSHQLTSSKIIEAFSRDNKEKQIQMSILEKLQQKNWKFGSKAQRSESVVSSNQIDKQADQSWGIVNKLCIMLKAKHKLKNLIKQRFSTLTQYERGLVGDLSDGKLISTKTINEQNRLLKSFITFSFHPGSFPIIIFKVFLLLLSIMNLFYIPIILGFELELSSPNYAFIVLTAVSYITEIIIKFKTSLYEKGEIITDTKLIAKKYVQKELVTDVISIIGLMLGSAQRTFFLLMIFRIKNVLKYMDDLNNHYYLAEKYHQLWVLSGLFGFIVMMAHYFACIFHYIGISKEDDPNSISWIKYYNLSQTSWLIRYNYALYFSFITCMTIGYGDITPENSYERSAVIIFSFVSTMCFSYSVNTIGNIFQDYFNKFQKQFIMRYNAINFMSNRSIGKELQLRVLKYIEYIHDIENDSPDKGFAVINQISKNLKSQIYNEYYGKILMQEKSFSLNFSKQSIEKLSLKIKERLYGPGEVIFEQEEQDYRLYYLMKGECEFYQYNKGGSKQSEYKTISHSSEKKFFGYKGFISGIPREMSCRSTNISHVFIITRQDLMEVLKEDPEDYEQFCKIRDQYLMYRNSFGEQCFGCKNFGHTLSGCPQIHLIRNKELLIFRHNFTENQKRKRRIRSQLKYKTLSQKQKVSADAQKYRLKVIVDLRKAQFQDEGHPVQDIILQQETTDKRFSKMYPYVKFKSSEMVLCDNYSYDEMSEMSESETDESSQSESQSQSCGTISEEDQDQSQEIDVLNEESEENEQSSLAIKEKTNSLVQQSDSNIEKSDIKKSIEISRQSSPDAEDIAQFRQVISNMCISQDDPQLLMRTSQKLVGTQSPPYGDNLQVRQLRKNRSKSHIQPQTAQNEGLIHHTQIVNPPRNLLSYFKDKDETQTNNDEFQKLNKVRINSKTMVQPTLSLQHSRKDQRLYTESPKISRQGTKKMTEAPSRKQTLTPLNSILKLQRKYSKADWIPHDQNEDSEFLIRDFDPFKHEKPTTSLPLIQQGRFFQSHSLLKQNTDGQRFGKQILEKEGGNQGKKDSILKVYEKQNQYLQQILFNLTLSNNNNRKRNSSFMVHSKQQPEKEGNQQETTKSTMKMNYNNLSMDQPSNSQKQQTLYSTINTLQQTVLDINQEQNAQINELFIFEFDTLREYTNYFPHNNANLVCQSFKTFQEKKKKLGKLLFQKLRLDRINLLNNMSSKLVLTPKDKK